MRSMHPCSHRVRALRHVTAVVPLFALCLAGRAHAEPNADDRALATALFNEGRSLMSEGRIAQACPKLEESHRLDPSGGTILNCVLKDNCATAGSGGGASSTTLNNCIVSENSALEGGLLAAGLGGAVGASGALNQSGTSSSSASFGSAWAAASFSICDLSQSS